MLILIYNFKGDTSGAGKGQGSYGSYGSQASDEDEDKHSSGRGSRSSIDMSKQKDDDDDMPPADPSNLALPTMLMAGTILGAVFRADLSKNRVDVETNNLRMYSF